MAEFDWGLQAIVRGSTSDFWNNSSTSLMATTDPSSCYDALLEMPKDHDIDNELLFNFPSLFDPSSSMLTDELQQLYKPFFSSVSYSSPSQNSPAAPTTPSSNFSLCKAMKEEPEPEPEAEEVCEKVTHTDQTVATTAYMPKYKRRKNQHKRVVLQVTAQDLSSDKWAWRKYGQKPIKGSPYPRSYYRCSSSKGCLARKQVEQSCTDPSMFIITYTAEHNHNQPTRRNALAGTIRHKFGTNKSPTGNTSSKAAKNKESTGSCTSPTSSLILSPGTPLVAEEEFHGGNGNGNGNVQRRIKDENDDIQMVDDQKDCNNNGILIPEVMFDDDFFSCFNDLDGFISEFGDGNCSTGTVSSESDIF